MPSFAHGLSNIYIAHLHLHLDSFFFPLPPITDFHLQTILLIKVDDPRSPISQPLLDNNTVKMKAAVLLTFVASAMAGLLQERACAGNNCKRQVTGTRAGLLPLTERMADCSSFQATTVVPDAV